MAFIKITESAATLAKKVRTILVGDEHLQAAVPHASDGTPLAMNNGAADDSTQRFVHASNDPLVSRLAGALSDASGTVTTGGTSQQVFAANVARKFLSIQNPVDATETLYVDIGQAASTTGNESWELSPGGELCFDSLFMPTGAVNVTAATTAHPFVAKEG